MPSKLRPASEKKPPSDKIFHYFDLLEQWFATTSMMPTVVELAEAADRSHSTTDIALNKLLNHGYISRTRLAHRSIRITEQGRVALAAWRRERAIRQRFRDSHARNEEELR